MTKIESQTISLLRLPMSIAIVFIHVSPFFPEPPCAPHTLLSWKSWYELFYILFSEYFVNVAVPLFFLFSGFLFFQKFETWDWNNYLTKIKRRVNTLVVPYFLWNLLTVILVVMKFLIDIFRNNSTLGDFFNWYHYKGGIIHMFWDGVPGIEGIDWLGFSYASNMPINQPLWFIRDLFITSLFTPLIFYAIRRIPIISLFVLYMCYLSRVWVHCAGLNPEATFFFSIGAYFAIHHRNFVEFSKRTGWISAILSVSSIIYLLYFSFGSLPKIFAFVRWTETLFGIAVVISLAKWLIERFHCSIPESLTQASFFIFAGQGVRLLILFTPIDISIKLLAMLLGGSSYFWTLVQFLIAPFVTVTVCIMIYFMMKKVCPRFLAILVGSRCAIYEKRT